MAGIDQFINLTMPLKPIKIAPFRMLGDLSDKLHSIGFVARFARVVRWDDHLEIKSNDETAASNQSGRLDSFAWNPHASPPVEEVDRHQLRNS